MKMLPRLLFAIPQALLVSTGLIVLMVSLIEFADRRIDISKRIKLPDILMPEHQMIETLQAIEKPDKPKVDDTPPPEIPKQAFDNIDGDAQIGEILAPAAMNTSLDLNIGAGLSAADGEFLPIVKIAPIYPRRALSRGIEGYVILKYTVSRLGTVLNPVIIEAKPERIFDKSAIKSALRYKYKPRVVDGKPVDVPGVTTKITFKLAK